MSNIHYLNGKVFWAKILGDPVDNYQKDGKEWTMDFVPDKEGLATLKNLGLEKKIRNKDDERGDFIQLRQREYRANGKKNDPITVVDAKNRPWNRETKIGNGSDVEVKIDVADYGKGKPMGVYPRAVRVLDLVAYVRQEFAELPEDNKYVEKADEFNPVEEAELAEFVAEESANDPLEVEDDETN